MVSLRRSATAAGSASSTQLVAAPATRRAPSRSGCGSRPRPCGNEGGDNAAMRSCSRPAVLRGETMR